MNALQLEKIGSLHLKETHTPETNPGEILLKVTHCAVCRTDAKMWERGQRDLVLPRVLGHEICGVSEESGERFAVWPGIACGHCEECSRGAENLCREMQITGFHKDGGFAEYVAVPESSLIPIPDDLPGEIASLAEPLACAINGLRQIRVREGERILIYGAGPVGLLTGLTVRARNASPFIREIRPDRLTRSKVFRDRIGVTCAEDSKEDRFDAAINAAPSSDTFSQGLSALRRGGRFCLFSGLTDDQPIPVSVVNEIHYRQLRIAGAYGCTAAQMKAALNVLADHKNDVKLLIEDHITLEQVPNILPKILAGEAFKFVVDV